MCVQAARQGAAHEGELEERSIRHTLPARAHRERGVCGVGGHGRVWIHTGTLLILGTFWNKGCVSLLQTRLRLDPYWYADGFRCV